MRDGQSTTLHTLANSHYEIRWQTTVNNTWHSDFPLTKDFPKQNLHLKLGPINNISYSSLCTKETSKTVKGEWRLKITNNRAWLRTFWPTTAKSLHELDEFHHMTSE